MRLVHLSAQGLHRRLDYDTPIDPVTIVIGDNGTGKSTLIGIPRLVLNGPAGAAYPVLGTSPDYDWKASVEMQDSGRTRPVCRWMDRGTHRATYGGMGGKLTEVQQAIAAGVGRAATWNLAAFLGDTPAKRQAFLESEVLRGASWSNEKMWTVIGEAGVSHADLEEVLTGGCVDTPDDDGRGMLASILGGLRDTATEANSTALRLSRVVQQDDLDAGKEELPAGTVTMWRDRKTSLDEKVAALRERRGEITGREAARDSLRRQLNEATLALQVLVDTDHDADIEKTASSRERANTALVEALAAGEELKADVAVAKQKREALQVELDSASRAAAEARARMPRSTIPGELDLGTIAEMQPVVIVHRRSGHMRTVEGRGGSEAHVLETSLETFHTQWWAVFDVDMLPTLGGVIATALRSKEAPLLDLDPLRRAVEAAEDTETGLKTQLGAARRAENTLNDKIQAARATYATRKQDLDEWDRVLTAQRAFRDSAGEKEASLRADIERLGTELGDATDGQLDALDAEITELQEEAIDAGKKADKLSDAAGAVARRADNRATLTSAEIRRSRAREMIKILERVQAEMLSELVSPLEEPVSRITRAVLGADFRVRLDGGASFWLVWADHEAPLSASRSEEAVAMMALRCAVQQHLGGWRHLVLDDMENLAQARRDRFVEAMRAEVDAGRLDNFIGACVEDGWSPSSFHAGTIYRRR